MTKIRAGNQDYKEPSRGSNEDPNSRPVNGRPGGSTTDGRSNMKAMVTITCPGGCGDEITVKAEDAEVAECADDYFARTLPDEYYEGKVAA